MSEATRVVCPACAATIALAANDTVLRCPSCDLAAPISRLGTAPGVALVPLAGDLVGGALGGYHIEALLGSGGMGRVYRARDEGGLEVAVKVLHPDLKARHKDATERFRREAEALRRLVHPAVVRLLDAGEEAGVHYLVTELAAGRDLARELAARGALPLDDAIAIMTQVCAGVAAAHARGIVHRDLKPANILVAEDGVVKVVDFGLAQLAGIDAAVTSLTRTDLAMGTFNYLSPEQRTSARNVDARADVFALGVIFYELVSGTLPLGSFRLPSELGRGLDRRSDAVVKRALAASPEDRFQTVDALAEALGDLRPGRRRGQRRRVLVAGSVGAAAVAAGLWVAIAGGTPPATVPPVPAPSPELDAGSTTAAAAPPDAGVAIADATVDAAPPAVPRGVADKAKAKAKKSNRPGKPGKQPDPGVR